MAASILPADRDAGDDRPSAGDAGPVPHEINRVQPVAAYELVVEQVKRAIFLGRFVPGDKLPPERDLAAQMLVSRTTIREAMRVLEGEGLIEVRRGATGGLLVKALSRLRTHEIESYMETQRELLDTIFEYRIANECMAARLAATRRSEEHLNRMLLALREMSDLCRTNEMRQTISNIARFRSLDSDFHLTIAQASNNHLIVRAVEDARAAMFLPIGKVFKQLEDSADEHHEEIFAAISDRDPDRAALAMRHHIETSRESLESLMHRPASGEDRQRRGNPG